ncbi:MAG: Gfo/Idh/MocA family protein [Gaiellaceae bacterium]
MPKKLRLGVIGAGSWAVASHLPNFAQRRGELEFVGVSRKGPELLQKIKDDFGFQIASEDYRDVLDAGIDICLVASPTGLHHEHAKAALESGAHVLVEKPVTIDPADAWELAETADRQGLHLVCSFGWNFRPMLRAAKELMESKGIGAVEQVVLHMTSATRELLSNTGAYPQASPETIPEAATWTDPRISGGGYGQAQLSHALGLALWLTELRGQEVFAYMSTILDSPVEHYDACSLRFTNGAVGVMAGGSAHLGYDGNKHQIELRAIGSEGHLVCDLQRELLWIYSPADGDTKPPVRPGDGVYDCDGPPHALVDLALGKEVRNCAPGELGARTVEVLDAAYRSARSGNREAVGTES